MPGSGERRQRFADADTTVADDRKSLTFVTPRAATTGRVVVIPPELAFPTRRRPT